MKKVYASAIVEHYHMRGTKETVIHASFEVDEHQIGDKEYIRGLYEERVRMHLDVLTIKLFFIGSKKNYDKGVIKFG